jgi:hypothetical protein
MWSPRANEDTALSSRCSKSANISGMERKVLFSEDMKSRKSFRMKTLFLAGVAITAIQVAAYSQDQKPATDPPVSTSQGSGVLSPDEKTVLLKQMEMVQAAINQWDFDTLLKFTHPAVFNLVGGKDAFEKAARAAMDQLKQTGIKFLKTDFGEPSITYKAGDEVICFVPRTSLLQYSQKTVRSQAYWVAIRTAGGSEVEIYRRRGN